MITYTPGLAAEMVAAGAKWASAHRDASWPWLINTDRLDVSDSHDCILGQLYQAEAFEADCLDGWDYALRIHIGLWGRCYDLGFAVRYDNADPAAFEYNTNMINDAWKALIVELRKTAPQPVPA